MNDALAKLEKHGLAAPDAGGQWIAIEQDVDLVATKAGTAGFGAHLHAKYQSEREAFRQDRTNAETERSDKINEALHRYQQTKLSKISSHSPSFTPADAS